MLPEKLEGSGGTQLAMLMKSLGYNKDVDFQLATVTSAPPDLKIKVDNMEKIELDKDDLIVAQHLTKYTRKVKLTSTSVTDAMTSAGYTPHTHDITSLVIEADLDFDDELKVGDRVIVVEIVEGETYVILDRAVTY